MPIVEFQNELGVSQHDWIRVRIRTVRGQVTHFTVQYETLLDGKRVPVIRYDSAHGFPHLDVLNQRGELVSKVRLPDDQPLSIALDFSLADIYRHWEAYRRRFFGE